MEQKKIEDIDVKWANYEIFMVSITLLSLFNVVLYLFVQQEDIVEVAVAVNLIINIIFLIDFFLRLQRAADRKRYFLRDYGWLDLIAGLPLPPASLARIPRLLRTLQVMRRKGSREVMVSLKAKRADTALLFIFLAVIYLLEFGSVLILRAESGAPNSTIDSTGNAFWWVLVTVSTVGYGDLVPVTMGGRIVSSLLIVAGIGVFGTLSGYLANSFLGQGTLQTQTFIKDTVDPVLQELMRLNEAQEEARLAQEEENQQLLARLEVLEKLLQEERN